MLNKVLFIFFITFLFSCSTESKEEVVSEDVPFSETIKEFFVIIIRQIKQVLIF